MKISHSSSLGQRLRQPRLLLALGLSVNEASSKLHEALLNLSPWGLDAELADWGHEVPDFMSLHTRLFCRSTCIEFSTIPFFRDVSLRLLAEVALEPPAPSRMRLGHS